MASTSSGGKITPGKGCTGKPAGGSRRKTSIVAMRVSAAIPKVSHGCPSRKKMMTTTVMTTAEMARSRMTDPLATETTSAASVLGDGGIELRGPEVRPVDVAVVELGIGGLPQQEVADAMVSTGTYEQVELG